MKYFLLFLFCICLQPVFAQVENRHAATPIDTAVFVARHFEGRLTRLREAADKNDVSAMTTCYAYLLGDIRTSIDYEEQKSPDSQRLASMKNILGKFENFAFDPMKPAELKPYLAHFDAFLALLKEK